MAEALTCEKPSFPVLSRDHILLRRRHDTEGTADAGAGDDEFAGRELAILARADTARDFAGDGIAAALERGIECGLESGGAGGGMVIADRFRGPGVCDDDDGERRELSCAGVRSEEREAAVEQKGFRTNTAQERAAKFICNAHPGDGWRECLRGGR